MTIRDLQYAIQDAIDRGVPDNAFFEAIRDDAGRVEFFAVDYNGTPNPLNTKYTSLGKVELQ